MINLSNPANIKIYCIKTSYSYDNNIIKYGEECFTPINDFGHDFVNWISVYTYDVHREIIYRGAHWCKNFGTLAQWRDVQIEQILNE